MPTLTSAELNADELRRRVEDAPEIWDFAAAPGFAAAVAALAIHREVGTASDELARFVFDAASDAVVPRDSLQSELVTWNGMTGVAIVSAASSSLTVKIRGFSDLVHPAFSRRSDGTLSRLVIFPELVARIVATRGAELAIVKPWALDTAFKDNDPTQERYRTGYSELKNADALRFAGMVARGRIALVGTHDLTAHVAGLDGEAWVYVRQTAGRVHAVLDRYLRDERDPSLAALVLPYLIGLIFDDLAQPPSYGSLSHAAVLDALLNALSRRRVGASATTSLATFPPSFADLMALARSTDVDRARAETPQRLVALLCEIDGG